MDSDSFEFIFSSIVVLFVLGIGGVFLFCESQSEANTYNKLCRPHVEAGWFDALVSELRVDGSCARSNP